MFPHRSTVLAAALWLTACGSSGGVRQDAAPPADGQSPSDATPLQDGSAPLAWVAVSITGCSGGPPGPLAPCTGAAPLTLQFSAVAQTELTEYRWLFGDEGEGSAAETTAQPVHVYAQPGTYDVSLVAAGPGGTAEVTEPGIIVFSAPIGNTCDNDGQCTSGTCMCADESCAPTAVTSQCSADCSNLPCSEGVCANLGAGNPAQPEPWQGPMCVADCGAASCPAGQSCQDLLAPDGTWLRGCFSPGPLAPLGASCVDSSGDSDSARCASGDCRDLGARHMCTASCDAVACPDGTTCATFGRGDVVCIADCATTACNSDPWLACQAPGQTGDLGFTISGSPSADGYCAPKVCASAPDCGPDGTCTDNHCTSL